MEMVFREMEGVMQGRIFGGLNTDLKLHFRE